MIRRKKLFCEGVTFDPIRNKIEGTVTLDTMKLIENNEKLREELSMCGLNEEEIHFKLKYDNCCIGEKKVNLTLNSIVFT